MWTLFLIRTWGITNPSAFCVKKSDFKQAAALASTTACMNIDDFHRRYCSVGCGPDIVKLWNDNRSFPMGLTNVGGLREFFSVDEMKAVGGIIFVKQNAQKVTMPNGAEDLSVVTVMFL